MKSVLAALAAAVCLAAPAAYADVITVRADEWCPFNCAPGSDKPGYGIEVMKLIFEKAGHSIDYKTMPWARALDECRKGAIASVIGTMPVESPDFVFPAESIGVSDNTFVVKKGSSWKYAGPASLESIRLGVNQDYEYGGEVGEYVKANKNNRARIDSLSGDGALEQNLKKVAAGRVDAVVESATVLRMKLASLGLADKVDFVGTVEVQEAFIAFSPAGPKSKEYAAIVEKGIAELRSSGKLAEILAKYQATDWK